MTDLFNTNAAADYLADAIPGESASYWYQRLVNARRSDRQQPFAIPFSTLGKVCLYEQSDLEQFVEFEKSRRLGKVKLSGRAAEALRAFGIGEPGGSSLGRVFKGGAANPHPDNKGGTLVQATIHEPLMVFAMTPEQAIAFGKELKEAGEAAQRWNNPQQAPEADNFTVTTLTDNADVLVQRMEYNK
jgi:hypothetical protein